MTPYKMFFEQINAFYNNFCVLLELNADCRGKISTLNIQTQHFNVNMNSFSHLRIIYLRLLQAYVAIYATMSY